MRDVLNRFRVYLLNHPVDNKFPYKKSYLLTIILAVILWQSYFYLFDVKVTSEYRRADATGFNHWWGQKFVYYYYYLKLFPLATTDTTAIYSKEGALSVIKNNPLSLRMEWGHWARFGESARVWMYMPYAILKGSPENPQIIFTNYLVFVFILILIIWVSWYYRKIFLGILIVAVLGNSPFLVYEIYNNNNVFGLMAGYSILLLTIHIPIIFNNFSRTYFFIPALSGVLTALMYNIRAESAIMILSCIVTYILFSDKKVLRAITLISLFFLLYFFTNQGIKSYFNEKFRETSEIVKKYGGVPFSGAKTLVHPLWHPLLCGLGDYDKKYGFKLHDTSVYNRILPVLRMKSKEKLMYPGETIYTLNEYYDSLHFYYKKPETIEGYSDEVRKIFLNAIIKDPLWYAGIIFQRARDFFFNLSPPGLFILNHFIKIPFSGWMVILLWIILLYLKEYKWLYCLLFTVPLGFSVILVFSAYNNSFQSVYHLLAAAVWMYIFTGYIYEKREIIVRRAKYLFKHSVK